MTTSNAGHILTLNAGSSSIKVAKFDAALRRVHRETAERVAGPEGVQAFLAKLDLDGVAAVGHRVVHGGASHVAPARVDAALLADLRKLVPLDPDHLPAEIALIEAVASRCPHLPQVACFDTAFHATLPPVARLLPIPRQYGLRRFGFHGLSYSYLMEELRRTAGAEADGRVILAHLGSGASFAAVRGGLCVDTTMGFTPTGGLVMGTRTGDLDPGVLLHLLRSENLTADQLDDVVNHRSGLRGVSETSSDVRDLAAAAATDPRAAEAIDLFCYQAKKFIGAMAAALGGVDTLVFAGGIGENAPDVRARICDGLGFLGIDLGLADNAANAALISSGAGDVTVRVIRTDEETMIARTVARVLNLSPELP